MSAGTFTLSAPIRLVSEANARGHWRRGHQRSKLQKKALAGAWLEAGCPLVDLPAVVVITRIAPRQLDSDNLSRACKALRDEVAQWFGVDDSVQSPLSWRYEQRRGEPKEYGIHVRVTTRIGLEPSEAFEWLRRTRADVSWDHQQSPPVVTVAVPGSTDFRTMGIGADLLEAVWQIVAPTRRK